MEGGFNMANGRLKALSEGLAGAALYAGLFIGAWRLSVDQWYLPAGLRFLALFLLPRHWVPFAILGDVGAMLALRVPLANQASDDEFPLAWAYMSPVLLAMGLYGLRAMLRRLFDVADLQKSLPAAALLFALCAKTLNVVVNLSLSGPPFGTNPRQFVSAVIGDYLGVLVIVLPFGLWLYRGTWLAPIKNVAIQSSVMLCLVLGLYVVVAVTGAQGTVVQLIPLVFMTLPAVYLTLLYGWNGAALGCVIVNLGIALALPRTGIMGAFDGVVLLAQAALCVASIVLLGVGAHITRLSSEFRTAFAELESTSEALTKSKGVARNVLDSAEARLRQQALALAAAKSNFDGFRHDVVSSLKASGQFEAAFDATVKGRAAIDELMKSGDDLYPFDIEHRGLYAVLMSDNFNSRWGSELRIRHMLVGESPKILPVPQRLAVYRGICAIIDAAHEQIHPAEIHTKVRLWKRRHSVGTTVEVRFRGATTALRRITELENIVSAYGGTVKYRRTRGVAFSLVDDDQLAAQATGAPFTLPEAVPAR